MYSTCDCTVCVCDGGGEGGSEEGGSEEGGGPVCVSVSNLV